VFCMCVCVFSITYVPAEYLEEYKASLEQAKEDVVCETAPVPAADPKYVLMFNVNKVCQVNRNRST